MQLIYQIHQPQKFCDIQFASFLEENVDGSDLKLQTTDHQQQVLLHFKMLGSCA